MKMKFAAINGISIHYQFDDAGAGKPLIVFSNSLATDFRIWQDCVNDLSADYSILRYDKRGHGLSGMGTPPYQIDDHVNDLVALMDHLGLSGGVVVGLSVGGLIAQGVYHARPDLVRALILCDTAAKIGNADMWNDRIAIAREGGLAALVDANMQRWFSPAFHTERATDLAGFIAMFTRTPLEGYIGTGMAIRDADFRDQAPSIAVPTTCVVGDQDGATPPDLVRGTADMIPGAKFVLVKDAGHIPCAEQPAAIIKIIRDMMAGL
jgi:3-oxoadipate enol-lactonase